jgi:hypothetical protein
MASAELSRRVGKVVAYPPLSEMGEIQRREFHEALLDADRFEDLPGKWQAAILKAEQSRPKLRVVRATELVGQSPALRPEGAAHDLTVWSHNPNPPADGACRDMARDGSADSLRFDVAAASVGVSDNDHLAEPAAFIDRDREGLLVTGIQGAEVHLAVRAALRGYRPLDVQGGD